MVFDAETPAVDKTPQAIQIKGDAWKSAGVLIERFNFFPCMESVDVELIGVGVILLCLPV